jgi:hypothetical protein
MRDEIPHDVARTLASDSAIPQQVDLPLLISGKSEGSVSRRLGR